VILVRWLGQTFRQPLDMGGERGDQPDAVVREIPHFDSWCDRVTDENPETSEQLARVTWLHR